jgi:GNAT superfamily N-acetyltransferase
MNARLRPLAADEVGAAADIFVAGVTDLARRFGLAQPTFTRDTMVPVYAHLRRTGIFEVAETDGRIVSICAATVRQDVWFLSMFWTLPEHQKRGIGRPLLDRVWERGLEAGATKQFVWASVDPAALAAYMRKGMLPGCPVFWFAGAPEGPVEPPDGYTLAAWEPAHADALDARVRGAAHPIDHAFWADAGAARRDVLREGERVGYFYARAGIVGPAAWKGDAHADAVLSFALAEAIRQQPEVRIAAPGVNHATIRFALAHRLRLATAAHLLFTEPIGALERYVPSGPALF